MPSNGDYFDRTNQAGRPQVPRLQSVNPVHHESNTSVPVTPGIQDWSEVDRPYLAAQAEETRREQRASQSQSRPVAVDDPNSQNEHSAEAISPSQADSGARSPEEVLRRLSLNDSRPSAATLEDIDPAQYPNLGLTGSIISATFCVARSVSAAR